MYEYFNVALQIGIAVIFFTALVILPVSLPLICWRLGAVRDRLDRIEVAFEAARNATEVVRVRK